ncbi:MAG: holo-ACP synthase [Gammaproteobacteria bacterium]|nr:holo-ACP synthase [Gammaproteobacteria bacterium]
MIYGIGTDIVAIARMSRLWGRYGEALAARLLAEDEHACLASQADPARFLAKRFAAKEAAAKALGTGFRDGLGFKHIAVDHDPLGKPLLRLHGPAALLAERLGVRGCHLSLSDETDYAVAFVIMTR